MEKNQEKTTKQQQSKEPSYPKLDYTITDPQQRNKLVHQIVNTIPSEKLTPYYLEQLTRYLVQSESTKKEKEILTDNRMITINRRETSFDQLVSKLENGEDGIYNFISQGDKNILLTPKIEITQQDIETIPDLKELREAIEKIQAQQKIAKGKKKYYLTKQLIEMRQSQYILKGSYRQPIRTTSMMSNPSHIDLTQRITVDEKGQPHSNCLISLFNPDHVSCILCNYSLLKESLQGKFESDMWYFMQDFDEISEKVLQNYPMLYDIMIYKIDGLSNKQIVDNLKILMALLILLSIYLLYGEKKFLK